MKNSKNLLIAVFVLGALLVGFLLGISVNYPKFNQNQVTGTIGKVNNYRNTKVTEADIELRNELLSDTLMMKHLKSYLNYHYVSAVKMNGDITFAVNEALVVDAFKNANSNSLAALKSYGNFLFSARTDLMLALSACNSANEANPLLLRKLLNQANNVITQMNYRKNTALEFVDALSTFINSNNQLQYEGLEKAHDQLAMNQLLFSLITKDKVVLKFLDKTKVYGNNKENLKSWNQQQLKSMIQQDVERLKFYGDVAGDAEKFNSFTADCEKFNMLQKSTELPDTFGQQMSDALKLVAMSNGAGKQCNYGGEKLGVNSAGPCQVCHNSANLALVSTDIKKLGAATVNLDAKQLGAITRFDAEILGGHSGTFDAEKLGAILANDAEKLGGVFDAEKLGALWDTEKLGYWDAEKLGVFSDAEKLGIYQW